MPRMRVRLSEWEIGFVDLASAYYGLSRGEYVEHLVRGIPCVPASEGDGDMMGMRAAGHRAAGRNIGIQDGRQKP